MPMRQLSYSYTDHPFNPKNHQPGSKGREGDCTIPNCERPPVVSRHWENDAYEDGWWGAYCQRHVITTGWTEERNPQPVTPVH